MKCPRRSRFALLACFFVGAAVLPSAAFTLVQDPSPGQPSFRRVEVFVTAISGTSIYFDGGQDGHISEGDSVLIFPTSGPQQRGTMRAVARESARAELLPGSAAIAVGDRAEVLVPEARFRVESTGSPAGQGPSPGTRPGAGYAPAPGAQIPAHPPWETDLGDVAPDTPLLAPLRALDPKERAYEIHGRAWFDLSSTQDKSAGDATYGTLRSGLDLRVENLFGRAGTVEFDTDFYRHTFEEEGSPDDDEDKLRIDRLNYRWGGNRAESGAWLVGRFLSKGMPEFGVIDGVEYMQRTDSGSHWGASLGGFPEPNDDLSAGQDTQASIFYQWRGTGEKLTLNTGFQQTWHKGKVDRDLVVMTSTWRPAERVHLFASLWLDLYGSNDELKSGLELTQFLASGTWRAKNGDGAGLTLSHFSFPELLRNELDEVTAEQVADSEVTRLGLNGWRGLTESIDLRARLDGWTDEDDSGGRVESTLVFRDALFNDGDVSVTLFQNEGKFHSGPGLRLSANQEAAGGWLRLSFETTETKSNDFFGSQGSLNSNVFRGSWDLALGRDWDLSLSLEQRDGDQEDATTLGLFLQRSFH